MDLSRDVGINITIRTSINYPYNAMVMRRQGRAAGYSVDVI